MPTDLQSVIFVHLINPPKRNLRDSNPRRILTLGGLVNRCHKPLGQDSSTRGRTRTYSVFRRRFNRPLRLLFRHSGIFYIILYVLAHFLTALSDTPNKLPIFIQLLFFNNSINLFFVGLSLTFLFAILAHLLEQ